jgi:hypothetical protein
MTELLKSASEEEVPVISQAVNEEELTPEEEQDLLHLERKVERAFYEAGKALAQIRDRRLYRSTHKTFEDYCQERFGYTRRGANYLIAGANVIENLGTNGSQILPTSERQVRSLASLDPAEQCQVWTKAVEQAGGKVPPARIVKNIVQQIRERRPVPNPYRVGDICEISVKENPELRGKGGCWAIVAQVSNFSCTVRTWDGECQVKIEHLKDLALSPAQREEVRQLSDRIARLQAIGNLDRGAYPLLKSLGKQIYLTPLEDKLLKVLEEEYEV